MSDDVQQPALQSLVAIEGLTAAKPSEAYLHVVSQRDALQAEVDQQLADRDAHVREAEERAFTAGHLAAQDQTDKYGETHETPAEAFAAYLTRQPAAGAHTEEQK